MVAPLAGIRVLEVANWLAAPSCAALMADMGADVIKVEPPEGDAWRHSVFQAHPDGVPTTYPFELDNRGKRSITVDLTRPGGPDTVRRLAAGADIFITNLIQRRREQYRLTDADLLAVNPQIIYVSFSGYGTEGPDSSRAGFDYAAFWARAGIMSLLGPPGTPPPTCRSGQGDHTTALNLLAATLAALRLRDLTAEGQVVEVTLVGTGLWTIGSDVSNALQSGKQPDRTDRTRPRSPLTNTYRCRDGQWILMIMASPDRYWPRFCRCFHHPEWQDDPLFASVAARMENSAQLVAMVDREFAAEGYEYWAARLDEYDLIWSPVQDLPAVVADPTIRALGAFTSVPASHLGPYETLSAPFNIRGADIAVRGPAPAPGEHTQAVMQEYGFADAEIEALAQAGVFS